MASSDVSARTIAMVNVAHTLDHYLLLVYPTAVLALAVEWGSGYASMIGLATGTFVAFGLFALPVGWIADRIGHRSLMAAFFFGCGAACFGVSQSGGETELAIWLFVLGMFTAIYHPVGSVLLVAHARQLGRTLGFNGVCGNLGAAAAPGLTALLASAFGWRAGFLVPGAVCVVAGVAYLLLVPASAGGHVPEHGRGRAAADPVARPVVLAILYMIAVVAGGFTYNMTSISLPKVIDERLDMTLPLMLTGSVATLVLIFGALSQFTMGQLVDRVPLPRLFAALSVLQPIGLAVAAFTTGLPMLIGLVAATAAIFGQVVINDAMVARYVPQHLRSKAFGIRYFFSFTTSGFAVPMIAWFHDIEGFTLVLGVAGLFGALIFACALGFMAQTNGGRPAVAADDARPKAIG